MVDSASPESVTADRIYAVVGLVAAVFGAVEIADRPWLIGLLVVALVPSLLVVVRRDPPLPVFALLTLLPIAVVVAVHDVGSVVFVTTAAASRIASRTDDRRMLAVVTVVVVGMLFVPILTGHSANSGAFYFAFGDLFGILVGVLLRRATRLAAELREAQTLLTEAAGREERQRIARDVHDLVAHSLTVVVLHVGGARRLLRTDPVLAEQALTDAERVCRESLDGIRGVVGILRDTDESPSVSLDVEALVETVRSAGLAVTAQLDDLIALPIAVRIVVYRVVQEALTNAARHGGPFGSAQVEVRVGQERVEVRVTSRAPDPVPATSRGHGLIGLREQVAAQGGRFSSGPVAGEWIVACELPPVGASAPVGSRP